MCTQAWHIAKLPAERQLLRKRHWSFLLLIDIALNNGRSGIVSACANDMSAIVSNSLLLYLLNPIFDLADAAAGLRAKANKCAIVPRYCVCTMSTKAVWKDWLQTDVPQWRDFEIAGAAKYLGTLLGPSVVASQGHDQIAKLT